MPHCQKIIDIVKDDGKKVILPKHDDNWQDVKIMTPIWRQLY